MTFKLPASIGSYRLGETLHQTGMTRVVASEARTKSTTQRVVVKTILGMSIVDEVTRERFRREVQLAMTVRHPNICAVLDFGYWGDQTPYLVLERLEGEVLTSWLPRVGPRPLEEAVALLDQALAGTEALHERGIVHRDLTPDNLFRTAEGVLKILDLGLARREGTHAPLTETGVSLGDENFMSPEQMFNARHLDARSDLFTLGKVAYWLLSGTLPFEGASNLGQKLSQMLEGPPPELPAVPPSVNRWVSRMMCVRKADRFPDATTARAALHDAWRDVKTAPP